MAKKIESEVWLIVAIIVSAITIAVVRANSGFDESFSFD